ncbi:MAG: hypothetical protein WBE64_13355, partial [Xanthobacteraceae bacterium]
MLAIIGLFYGDASGAGVRRGEITCAYPATGRRQAKVRKGSTSAGLERRRPERWEQPERQGPELADY